MRHTTPSFRRSLLISVLILVAAQMFIIVDRAHAALDYGSGAAGGATGTPVLSTVPYTAVSDVLIVGDSITVGNYKALAAKLPGVRLAVNARSGRGTVDAVNQVLAMPYVPPRVIMAVGSNDVFNPPVMAGQIARLRAALEPRGVQVSWVDVQVSRIRYSSAVQLADQRNTGWVNAQIHSGCVAPCTVIGWGEFLSANPAYRLPAYLRDGVHTTAAGTAAWAALIAGEVSR
jgi:lysophospholipase L1-like esterase